MALKKTCPGCGKVISYNSSRCEECSEKYEEHTKQRYKQYKSNRTDVKEQRFYSSSSWLSVRDDVKVRDKGLCLLCLSRGDTEYVDTVHHIEELKECWDKRLDKNNLICLCESCHQLVHEGYKTNKLDIQREFRNLIQG